ncbi:MAG: hypothetical protein WKF84_29985 [Pyrinomonadaceae bacterium]
MNKLSLLAVIILASAFALYAQRVKSDSDSGGDQQSLSKVSSRAEFDALARVLLDSPYALPHVLL